MSPYTPFPQYLHVCFQDLGEKEQKSMQVYNEYVQSGYSASSLCMQPSGQLAPNSCTDESKTIIPSCVIKARSNLF